MMPPPRARIENSAKGDHEFRSKAIGCSVESTLSRIFRFRRAPISCSIIVTAHATKHSTSSKDLGQGAGNCRIVAALAILLSCPSMRPLLSHFAIGNCSANVPCR